MNPLLLAFLFAFSAWAQPSAAPLPERLNLPSRHLSAPLQVDVHLPREDASAANRRYPLCLLLHGGGGSAVELRELGLAELARRHRVILVVPDAGSALFVDPPDGKGSALESALLQDLLPELERRYRTRGSAQGRMVAGISLGGFAALHMGLRHPELFGVIASLSGVVDVPRWGVLEESFLPVAMKAQLDRSLGSPGSTARNRKDLNTLLESLSPKARFALPFLRLDCGSQDPFLAANRRFAAHLDQLGIEHALRISPDGHDGNFWARQLDDVLRAWVAQLSADQTGLPDRGTPATLF